MRRLSLELWTASKGESTVISIPGSFGKVGLPHYESLRGQSVRCTLKNHSNHTIVRMANLLDFNLMLPYFTQLHKKYSVLPTYGKYKVAESDHDISSIYQSSESRLELTWRCALGT